MAGAGGGPLGLGDFGEVDEAVVCFQKMAKTMKRLGEIRDNVEADRINVERYVKELAIVTMHLTKAAGECSSRSTCGSSICSRQVEVEATGS